MHKLRVGLITDSVDVPKYVQQFVIWASKQESIDVSHLIVVNKVDEDHRENAPKRDHKWKSFPRRLVEFVERSLLERYNNGIHADHFEQCDISALIPHKIDVSLGTHAECIGRPGEIVSAELRDQNIDLFIAFDGCDLPPGIEDSSRLGTIRLRLSDTHATRECPSGFWECFHGCAKTGFVIERLNASAELLVIGYVTTQFFYSLNQAFLARRASERLKYLLQDIGELGRLPPAEPKLPYSGPLNEAPSIFVWLVYGIKLASRLLGWALSKLLGMQMRWSVLVIPEDWRDATLYEGMVIRVEPGRFLADPFLVSEAGKTYCFVEDFSSKENKAKISVFEVGPGYYREHGPCLVEPFHLSFPFVFRFEEDVYMIPESCAARQIRLYRCKKFPCEWELDTILIDDLSAADSMLFHHNSRWWLLTNIDRSGLNDCGGELHLYYSDSPKATRWNSHPKNPIVFDPGHARNGGCVHDQNGRLYRVAQAQGFDLYGHHTSVFEITELTEESYKEELVTEIRPGFKKSALGTHHMSALHGLTVVDFVEKVPLASHQSRFALPRLWQRPDRAVRAERPDCLY
ncbi:MAG: hypothetical protein EKK29_11310 [Hyphomicrobiales bacterium]|nr:MAG: hypothetical protein EKK29_11310 [Hyphomicrobiales bacterium]